MKMTDYPGRQKPRYKISGGMRYPLNPDNRDMEAEVREAGLGVYADMAHETAAALARNNPRSTPANARSIYNRSFRAALHALISGAEPEQMRIDERFADVDT